ncbi:hypothetical protein ILUMI_15630 [Ignelater luminosus]|uniref:Uncharacterized protein n=1 Tax=Ignelater luminosus TaxID=2038154 RepID=A0A8K0CN81_IGNLU|nr:hypothetical protein ILUMI_15630 [Ignelater luminosus]
MIVSLCYYVKYGIEEIGLSFFYPLVIKEFDIEPNSDALSFTAALWNFTARGLENYELQKFRSRKSNSEGLVVALY